MAASTAATLRCPLAQNSSVPTPMPSMRLVGSAAAAGVVVELSELAAPSLGARSRRWLHDGRDVSAKVSRVHVELSGVAAT